MSTQATGDGSETGEPAWKLNFTDLGAAEEGTGSDEVVIAISPAFGDPQTETLSGVPHAEVLRETMAGIEEEGLSSRVVRFLHTADLGVMGLTGAKLCGSGIAIGIQSRGTTVIHQEDLVPLNNLELFPQGPLLDPEKFRHIGQNGARYAKGEAPSPVPVVNDEMTRPKYQALAAVWHIKETELIDESHDPVELEVEITQS